MWIRRDERRPLAMDVASEVIGNLLAASVIFIVALATGIVGDLSKDNRNLLNSVLFLISVSAAASTLVFMPWIEQRYKSNATDDNAVWSSAAVRRINRARLTATIIVAGVTASIPAALAAGQTILIILQVALIALYALVLMPLANRLITNARLDAAENHLPRRDLGFPG